MAIGNHYNRVHSQIYSRNANAVFAVNLRSLLTYLHRQWQISTNTLHRFLLSIFSFQTTLTIFMLVLLSGDVEQNPGPDTDGSVISILHCNTRSIRNKLDYIRANFLDFEILCFTETHLDFTIPTDSLLLHDTYDPPYRKDRTNHGGGILTYVSNQIIHKHRPDLEIFCQESIWVECRLNKQIYLIGNFYSPRTSDTQFFDSLNRNIEMALESSGNIILVGDLNEDLLNDNVNNLKDVMLMNSLRNVITLPTRNTALLDPVIVPDEMIVLDSGIITSPNEFSDHSATYIRIPHDYPLSTVYKRTVWLYKRADFDLFNDKILSEDWNCLNDENTDSACNAFTDKFMKFAKESIPTKEVTIRPSDKPWYDSEIRRHSRKRDRLKTKAVKSGKQADWTNYKHERNKVNNLIKHAKEVFFNNIENLLFESFSGNKRNYWKIIRHFVKGNSKTSSVPPLCSQSPDGRVTIHSTDEAKADCFNEYFASISSVNDEHASLPPFESKTNSKLSSIVIEENEIKDIIENLNPNKAIGPDFISNKMLKGTLHSVTKPLCILFNKILYNRSFPSAWKKSLVLPVYKKDDKTHTSNYRPISLLSNVAKVMERIVFKKIHNFLLSNNIFYKYQSGFLPGHSTTYQLVDIFHHICQSFDEKQYSCMVFCDISKAFDRVWHSGLLFKLKQYGIDGAVLEWIGSYLSNRQQRVIINSSFSTFRNVTAGVPQGSVLGPLFFLIYVNDISEHLLSLTRLFADDSSLYFSASNLNDLEGVINHDLAIISQWAKRWLVTFNPNKTEAMLFSFSLSQTEVPQLIFDNTSITFVDNHKHLGITLNNKGRWHDHIQNIIKSANKVICIMRRLKFTLSRAALNQIYLSYVRPILEYSSIVWDGCTIQDFNSLEKLQNEAARIVTGLTRSVSLDNLYKECGWAPLSERRKFQKLCFMYKCNNNMLPDYISDLIPPLVRDVSAYPLRNANDFMTFRTRTETFRKSCIPSSIVLWNSLDRSVREIGSFEGFRNSLKTSLFPKITTLSIKGDRYLSVIHCRIRNCCSNLNYDLFRNHLKVSPLCSCNTDNETSTHYFFECPLYDIQRLTFFRRTRHYHPLSLNTLLFGKDTLTKSDNDTLFLEVLGFIKNTGRFR
ncbi:MAG: hypothetical protein JAY74_15080 [Candidatus Thiodiazotropha taylori]|nr:hypothetical protein [Candidatus Thiodiazotropha taylori]